MRFASCAISVRSARSSVSLYACSDGLVTLTGRAAADDSERGCGDERNFALVSAAWPLRSAARPTDRLARPRRAAGGGRRSGTRAAGRRRRTGRRAGRSKPSFSRYREQERRRKHSNVIGCIRWFLSVHRYLVYIFTRTTIAATDYRSAAEPIDNHYLPNLKLEDAFR